MKHFYARTLAVTFSVLGLSACEGKMQKMSNQELAQKNTECVRMNPTAPGRVTACENIRKECEARRKQHNYAC